MASAEAESSFKICITVLEKKIRNLEKRKSKLDSYKGKEGTLDKDQQEAVTKYDSVLMNLDFARELHKHFNSLKSDCEKHSKKQTKKERLERQANDLAKTRNIFKLNKLCHLMRQSVVRTALQDGAVPQVSLETGQLEMLDKLFTLVCPSHDCTMEKLNSSSEHTFNLFEKFDKKFSEDSEYKYNQAYPLVERLCSENVLETLTSFVSGKPTSSEMMVTPTQGGGDNAGVTVTNEDEEEEEEEDGSKLRNDEDEDRKMVEKLGETFSEEEFRPNKTPSSSETVSKQFNTPPQAAVTEVQYNSPPTSIPYPPTHLEVTGEDKEAWKEQQFHHNNHYTYHPPTESRPLHDIVSSVQGHYNFLQESHIEQQQQQTRQEDRQQQRLVATTAHTSPNLHMQFVVKDSNNNNNSNSTVMSESFYHHHHHHHHHHLPQHLQQPPLLQSQQIHHHHQQQQLLLQQQQASQKLEQPLNQSSASNVTNENNSSIDLITYQQHNYYQQQQRHMALNDIYSVNGQGQTSSDRSSQEPPEQLPSSNYIYQQDQLQTHDQGEAGKMASETTNNNTSNYQQQQQLYHQQRNQLSKSAMNPNANVFQSTNRSEASINQSSASSQLPINAAKNNGSNDEAKGTSNPSAAVKELNNNVNYPNGKVNDNKSYNKYDDKNKGGHQGAKGGGAYNQQHYNNNRYNNQSRPSFNRQGQMSAYRQMGGRYVGGSAVRSSGNYGYYNNNNNYNSAGGNGNYSASGKSPATVATAN